MPMNTRSVASGPLSQQHHSTHVDDAPRVVRHEIPTEEFRFPRPNNDEEIEALFQKVLGNMTIDQKWQMVYDAEHLRWSEERRRKRRAERRPEPRQSVPLAEGSPEWYIHRFRERTITPKQASSLEVSLRSNQLR